MAERITLGGKYETENEDGETITRNKYWIDVSSSLMNRVNALAIQENEAPGGILADVVSGERVLDVPDTPENNDESE